MKDTPVLFREVAGALHANGYRPVPITHGKKYPPIEEWQRFTFTPESTQRFGNCGAGILLDPQRARALRSCGSAWDIVQMLTPADPPAEADALQQQDSER